MNLLVWVILLTLVAVNALYVAAEFAIISVRRSRIQTHVDEGHPLAKRLMPIISNSKLLDDYIAVCQIGITLSSLILGAYGQSQLSETLMGLFVSWGEMQLVAAQSTSALVVLIGLTMLQMLFGELIPKSLALQFPTQLALWTTLPLRWSYRIFSPFVFILNGSSDLILRVFKHRRALHQHIHSADEIDLILSESREGGMLEETELQRLRQALRLGERPVSEIMVPRTRIEGLDVDSSFDEVAKTFSEKPFTRLIVYEKSIDDILGYVHVRDVAAFSADHPQPFSLRQITRQLLAVYEGLKAEDLIKIMRLEKKQLALVLDEYGGTAGLVGIADILDEFMGDVSEKTVTTEQEAVVLADGRVRLPGELRLDVAASWTGVEWTGESVTIGGKITEELGHLPLPGERVEIDGVQVEIEKASPRRVVSVLVKPVAPGVEKGLPERPARSDPRSDQ